PPPLPLTPFPYTTLFRSRVEPVRAAQSRQTRAHDGDGRLPNTGHRALWLKHRTSRQRRRGDTGPRLGGADEKLVSAHALDVFHRSEEHTSELQSLRHLVC